MILLSPALSQRVSSLALFYTNCPEKTRFVEEEFRIKTLSTFMQRIADKRYVRPATELLHHQILNFHATQTQKAIPNQKSKIQNGISSLKITKKGGLFAHRMIRIFSDMPKILCSKSIYTLRVTF